MPKTLAMPKAKPSVVLLSDTAELPTKPARKGNLNPPPPRLGGNTYSDKTWQPIFTQPRVKKQEKGLDTWSNTALILAQRALRAAQTYGKKDFNSLYRLVLSAGIAYDKAFPQVQQPTGTNLVFQLFGSLGSDTTRAILEPTHPTIDITPTPLPAERALEASDHPMLLSTPSDDRTS
jgi:hypothetical protein